MLSELAYVVAPAYNNIEIVLMAFPTADEANAHLLGLGLSLDKTYTAQYTKATLDGQTMPLEDALDEQTPAAQALRNALFAKGNYYGGCGECSAIEVIVAPLGQPVVAFNLD